MKTKEIAQKYGINQEQFEHFLQAKHLNFKKSLFSSFSVNDSDVDSYVRSFNEFQAEIEAKRKAEEEAKRKAEAEAKRKAEEEAKRKAEEEAKRKAEEEARKKQEAQQRNERIRIAETEFLERDTEEKNYFNIETEEGRNAFMANCVKLYKEKLKGTWHACGSVKGSDAEVIGLRTFNYSGNDGMNNEYGIYLTGNECGQCFLCINHSPSYFVQTMGEIAFSEDNNYFTLICPGGGNYVFQRG